MLLDRNQVVRSGAHLLCEQVDLDGDLCDGVGTALTNDSQSGACSLSAVP